MALQIAATTAQQQYQNKKKQLEMVLDARTVLIPVGKASRRGGAEGCY